VPKGVVVLQCVAVCCSVCSVLQSVAVTETHTIYTCAQRCGCVAVCCSVLQFVAVCYSVL